MKQESTLNPKSNEDEMDIVSNTINMTEDIVEDFARQLDQVVRIRDTMVEEVQEVQRQQLGDSDQDDEDVMFGYQQLPQDDDADDDYGYDQLASGDDEEGENQAIIKDPLQIEVAASDRLKPETSDLIKTIMGSIRLPDEAIPEWAKKIPEETWLPRTAIEKK